MWRFLLRFLHRCLIVRDTLPPMSVMTISMVEEVATLAKPSNADIKVEFPVLRGSLRMVARSLFWATFTCIAIFDQLARPLESHILHRMYDAAIAQQTDCIDPTRYTKTYILVIDI